LELDTAMSREGPKTELAATDEERARLPSFASDDKSGDEMSCVKYEERDSEVSTSAEGYLNRGARPPKRTSSLAWLALFVSMATVVTAMSAAIAGSASASNSPPQAQVLAALQMTEINWHKGGWNNMMLLSTTVRNNGGRDVKDIKVVCEHLSNSETKIDSNSATIYGPFLAGESRSIHGFDLGIFHEQAKGTNCLIVHATLATKRWWQAAA
jgi:hypothetical protein